MKVYIVTSGCYADYHIDAVCLDKKEAEVLVENMHHSPFYEYPEVEELDTDNYKVINDGLKLFYITVFLEEDRLTLKDIHISAADSFQSLISSDESYCDYSRASCSHVVFPVRAKDEEHAKKLL